MKKRIICAALIITLAISAYGCGQSNDMSTAVTEGITAGDVVGKSVDGVTRGATEAADAVAGEAVAESIEMMADDFDAAGAMAEGTAASTETFDESIIKDLPEAGQLTAGEWSDNDNWGFFANLVNSGTITFPSFGIDPTQREAVSIKTKDGSPVVNARASLLDAEGNVIWSGVTNKEGVVYLFNRSGTNAVSVEVEKSGKKQKVDLKEQSTNGQTDKVSLASNRDTEIVFEGEGELYKATDIMFIVDATGSMSDEMLFLQSEFTAITKEIGTKNTRYSVNFYRDTTDDYVTKCSDFSDDVKTIQKQLNNEEADGGGDYPEAVAEVLTETMFNESWKEDSVKLAFLIFDAPPHDGKEQELLAATEEAAKKGIRLIPVVASNADRDTELFGRAIAITTGGTYVFLTDDSGIGDSHEEPIIGSYEVRPLYDTIIDIIRSYQQ